MENTNSDGFEQKAIEFSSYIELICQVLNYGNKLDKNGEK